MYVEQLLGQYEKYVNWIYRIGLSDRIAAACTGEICIKMSEREAKWKRENCMQISYNLQCQTIHCLKMNKPRVNERSNKKQKQATVKQKLREKYAKR